jgi:hypothetical protein
MRDKEKIKELGERVDNFGSRSKRGRDEESYLPIK